MQALCPTLLETTISCNSQKIFFRKNTFVTQTTNLEKERLTRHLSQIRQVCEIYFFGGWRPYSIFSSWSVPDDQLHTFYRSIVLYCLLPDPRLRSQSIPVEYWTCAQRTIIEIKLPCTTLGKNWVVLLSGHYGFWNGSQLPGLSRDVCNWS